MANFQIIMLAIFLVLKLVAGYVDFGSATLPCNIIPMSVIPQHDQLPGDLHIQYAPYSSHILAIAPSVTIGTNGTFLTSWSLHTRATKTAEYPGLHKRGPFSGIPIPTCQPCDGNGDPIKSSNGATCTPANNKGPFRDGGLGLQNPPSNYCFQGNYGGALLPVKGPSHQLPCCPQCKPPNGTDPVITSGVLSGVTGISTTTTTQIITTSRVIVTTTTAVPGGSGAITTPLTTPVSDGSEVTVTITASSPLTLTQTTLSIETITPTNLGSPVLQTRTRPNTISGCGTARGCGTVVGSGTVYLAPFGFPAVTSSGTVNGCAPTVIGCGTMIATTGTFTGSASITGCGEGTGSATLIGSGTVWPAGFMDMISFVSSGTVAGSGRVRGCGILTGTGTFTVSEPYTETITEPITSGALPTVNVYVSYCPQEAPLVRLAGNVTEADSYRVNAGLNNGTGYHYLQNVVTAGRNYTAGLNSTDGFNSTSNSTNFDLCHVCPEDAGICCPPYTDCGADGHCPWSALVNSGYARFGLNLVNAANSSQSMGMEKLPDTNSYALSQLRAPGLPGNRKSLLAIGKIDEGIVDENGETEAQRARRDHMGDERDIKYHVHAHGRVGGAHFRGHG